MWLLLSSYHFEREGRSATVEIAVGEMKCGANKFTCDSALGFRACLDQVYKRDFCMRQFGGK